MMEFLTRAEMETRFDGEWVIVADPELNENLDVLGGRIAYHSQSQAELYEEESILPLKHCAFLCFVPMPERIWINLGLFY